MTKIKDWIIPTNLQIWTKSVIDDDLKSSFININ
jgi:hypothetical protein